MLKGATREKVRYSVWRGESGLLITSLNSHFARFQSRTIYCFSFNTSGNRREPAQMGQT